MNKILVKQYKNFLVEDIREILEYSNQHRDWLSGALLGQTNMTTTSDGLTWRIRFKNRDPRVIEYMYEEWEGIAPTKPRTYMGNETFNTLSYTVFREYRNFYERTKTGYWRKIYPEGFEITPKILAYWYMFEGMKKEGDQGGYTIELGKYSNKDIIKIEEEMRRRYTIELRGTENRLKKKIDEKDGEKLRRIIGPHMIDRLKYKM
jgi:hypothetical protein